MSARREVLQLLRSRPTVLWGNSRALKEEEIIGHQQISLEILGTGECVPSRRVHSEQLDLQLGKPLGWTLRHTGVESRAFADAGEDAVSMGAMAAKQALKNADVDGRELDAIISGPTDAAARRMAWGLEKSQRCTD